MLFSSRSQGFVTITLVSAATAPLQRRAWSLHGERQKSETISAGVSDASACRATESSARTKTLLEAHTKTKVSPSFDCFCEHKNVPCYPKRKMLKVREALNNPPRPCEIMCLIVYWDNKALEPTSSGREKNNSDASHRGIKSFEKIP